MAATYAAGVFRLFALTVLAIGLLLVGPPASVLWATAGVYAFAIEDEIRGDAGDGRVFTPFPFGGCGHLFELYARYEVHARNINPSQTNTQTGAAPGVPLQTDSCLPIVQVTKAPLPMHLLETGANGVLVGAVVVKVRRGRIRAPGG